MRLKPGTEDVKQLVVDKSNCQGKSLGSRFERFTNGSRTPRSGAFLFGGGFVFFFCWCWVRISSFEKNYSKISVHQNFLANWKPTVLEKKGGKCFRHATKNIPKKSYTMGLPPGGGSLLPCRRGAGGLSEYKSLDFGKSPKGYRVTFQRSFPPFPTPSKSPVH